MAKAISNNLSYTAITADWVIVSILKHVYMGNSVPYIKRILGDGDGIIRSSR